MQTNLRTHSTMDEASRDGKGRKSNLNTQESINIVKTLQEMHQDLHTTLLHCQLNKTAATPTTLVATIVEPKEQKPNTLCRMGNLNTRENAKNSLRGGGGVPEVQTLWKSGHCWWQRFPSTLLLPKPKIDHSANLPPPSAHRYHRCIAGVEHRYRMRSITADDPPQLSSFN